MIARRAGAGVLAVVLAACSGGSGAVLELNGSPHPASDAGVVTAADRHHLVLDGKRTYSVPGSLVVFLPGTLQIAPLAGAIGRYALIGTRKGAVSWVEPLTVVVDLPEGPTSLFYGTLVRVAGASATFADGTVLALAPGVSVPSGVSLPASVRADIDPSTRRVRALVPS